MRKLLSNLKQPYPYYNENRKLPGNAFIIFACVFLFLLLFSPFSVNKAEHKFSYAIICGIHALNAALVYWLYFLLVNTLFTPLIKEDNWKVYKSLLVVAIALLFIGLGSFLLRPLIYNNPDNFSWHYFINETINTILLGSLVFAGFTFFDFYRLLKTNRTAASGFGREIEKHKTAAETDQLISVVVENMPYRVNLARFLFAKAEGNYVEFYFNKDGKMVKELKRASLKSIEEQLVKVSPAVIKTHRAFLVNTNHIIKMTGNAQGYQLYFDNIDFPVPVSRALIPAFRLVMKEN